MHKLLFFDYRSIQSLDRLKKILEKPQKHRDNPFFQANLPWEIGNLTLYGSVIQVPDGPFQAWYTIVGKPWTFHLSYAESDDGIVWRRPLMDVTEGHEYKTNIVLNRDAHGAAILYDRAEPRPDHRYKLLCGAKPGDSTYAFSSADGIHWKSYSYYPVINSGPDCPMGLLRQGDGRYAAYHRVHGNGRRVFRSESWNFKNWSAEPRLVFEADAGDPPMTQFYGLGSTGYGVYELGCLWIYHVEASDLSGASGYQETELAYARSGYAWHRMMPGCPFLQAGVEGEWDQGNIQMASSIVYLPKEIRFYYASSKVRHSRRWELLPQLGGFGMAVVQPDRFVGLSACVEPGSLITLPRRPMASELRINASVREGGYIKAAVIDSNGDELSGYGLAESIPIIGDHVSEPIRWTSASWSMLPGNQAVRLRLVLSSAVVYALIQQDKEDLSSYYEFLEW